MRIRKPDFRRSAISGDNGEKAAAFRRRHRVGERISGRIVSAVSADTAWVSFDGTPLLTSIPSCPPPGTVLHFHILQLHPEITLRPAMPDERGHAGGLPSAVQTFYATRAAFETCLDALPPLPAGQTAFLRALPEEHQAKLAAVHTAAREVNASLPEERTERLLYPPWIVPRARESELLATPTESPSAHAVLGFRLPPFGCVQIRAVMRAPQLRCRVYAECPQKAAKLAPLLLEALDLTGQGWNLECGTPEVLPKRFRGGVPAELLAPLPSTFAI